MINLGAVEVFVTITEEARTELKRQLKLSEHTDQVVRIFVMIDRFAGFVYDLEFSKRGAEDYYAIVDGIPLVVERSSLEYVKGMEIDYNKDKHEFSLINKHPTYNCVPGSKFECPSCNLYQTETETA